MRLESHGLGPGELVARHDPQVRAVMRGMFGNSADADDAAQVARIRIDAAADRIGPQAWRYVDRLARNAGLDAIARLGREPIDLTDDERDYPTYDPFVADERDTAAERVAAIQAALSPKHFTMLVERELDGASHDELAQRHGMTPASVRVILTRARQRARAAVNDPDGRSLGLVGWWRCWRDRLADALRDRLAAWSSFAAPLTDYAAPAIVTAAALVVAPTNVTHPPQVIVPATVVIVPAPIARSEPAAARTTTTPTAATTGTTPSRTTATTPPIARIDTPPVAPRTTAATSATGDGADSNDSSPKSKGGIRTFLYCDVRPFGVVCDALPDE